MKPYGANHEGPNVRVNPDKADISELGLPSRRGRLKSRHRRSTRRIYKKKERQAARRRIRRDC
jgi:hypothetical protein